MIVKDDTEVEMLDRCLDSIQPYVDDVFLTVTRPNQPKIAKLAEGRKIKLSEFKWIPGDEPWRNWDFSAARNFNFSQVPKGYDWIMWLDSDDIFVGGELLRDIAQTTLDNGKDSVFFSYWYSCNFDGEPSYDNLRSVELEHMRERLLRPGKIVWKGKLHETPIPVDGAKLTNSAVPFSSDIPIAVMHGITDKQGLDRLERNRTILELQLEGEGDNPDPRTLLYLMKIYAEFDDPKLLDKCLEYGKVYMAKSGWAEERAVACEIMGNIYGKRGDNRNAADWYLRGIGEYPHQPMVYLRLAQAMFNLGKYRECKHWLNIGMGIEVSNTSTMMNNYGAMKALSSALLLKLAFQVEKDTKKAIEAAKLLNDVDPSEAHVNNIEYLTNIDRLNDACKFTDKLCEYLSDIGEDKSIIPILNQLPMAISSQPFAIKLRRENSLPRKWGKKEICYFANFGGPHFEKWDATSLTKGIGGSETAVIRLSELWVQKGYKVVVYGDPEKPCEINGVVYLPWYWFNPNDEFNIFIQWRGWGMVKNIKAKKKLIDLHDVFAGIEVGEEDLKHIDKLMVKSNFHRQLAQNIPDYKFGIISNGI